MTVAAPLPAPGAVARALAALLVATAAGCAVHAPPPVPTPRWESVDVDHTTSVRKLGRELGMAVRRDPEVHSMALEGEYGRIVFLDGTRDILVAGRRVEAGETIRLGGDDLPLLTRDAAAIRAAWQEATAESRTREAEPSAGRAGRGPPGRRPSAAPGDPAWSVALTREWRGILIHHSATDNGNMEKFDKYHREVNRWKGVGYDFVICNGDGGPDGLVETTFRWKTQDSGAHAGQGLKEYNDHWVGICLVGDFNETRPSARQLASLRRLIRFLQDYCGIPDANVRFHRDVRDTDCPGSRFPVRDFLADSPRAK